METVECCLMRGSVELRHHRNLQLARTFLRQRETDQAASVFRHEVDGLRRAHLRRDDEIALILAILRIDQDKHAPVARIFDQFLDG